MVRQGKKYVAYYRVSTAKQGKSGLGLEAQQEAVAAFVKASAGSVIECFEERESGKNNDRPMLIQAMELAMRRKATLIIAKLDRLSRNAAFLLSLRDANVDFVACDLPEMNTLTLGVMAVVAQYERELISQRTKAALASAKRRGVKLGCPLGAKAFGQKGQLRGSARGSEAMRAKADDTAEGFRSVLTRLTAQYAGNASAIARQLNEDGETTPRGKPWNPMQVIRTMDRLGLQG